MLELFSLSGCIALFEHRNPHLFAVRPKPSHNFQVYRAHHREGEIWHPVAERHDCALPEPGVAMRYYFHLKDGEVLLDDEGLELGSLAAVRKEAVQSSIDLLKGAPRRSEFWAGEPWMLWVTDGPNGAGNTVLAISFSSRATH
jgi:hypothetical protein